MPRCIVLYILSPLLLSYTLILGSIKATIGIEGYVHAWLVDPDYSSFDSLEHNSSRHSRYLEASATSNFPFNLKAYSKSTTHKNCSTAFKYELVSTSPMNRFIQMHSKFMRGDFSFDSNTSIPSDLDVIKIYETIYRRDDHQANQIKHTPLKLINIGFGTTGTTSLFHVFCKSLALSGLHFNAACGSMRYSPHTYPILEWFRHSFVHCVVDPSHQRNDSCLSNIVLDNLYNALSISFGNHSYSEPTLQTVADSPIPMIYPYILPLIKKRMPIIVQSIRNSSEWRYSRLRNHKLGAIMCHPSLWDYVPHPFDVIGCVVHRLRNSSSESSSYVADAIVHHSHLMVLMKNDSRLVDQAYEQAFIAMNTFNAAISPQEKLHIVCLWDAVSNRQDGIDMGSLTAEDMSAMKHQIAH